MTGFTLEEVLIHEFGHWVVAQECDIHPDGVVVRGILWNGSRSVVADYGAMPFSTTFRNRIEEAVTYAAGLVAEQLALGTFEPSRALETLERDPSYAHDFKMMLETAASEEKQRLAVVRAHDLLAPRIVHIRNEAYQVAAQAATLRNPYLEVSWSALRAASLSGRPTGWF